MFTLISWAGEVGGWGAKWECFLWFSLSLVSKLDMWTIKCITIRKMEPYAILFLSNRSPPAISLLCHTELFRTSSPTVLTEDQASKWKITGSHLLLILILVPKYECNRNFTNAFGRSHCQETSWSTEQEYLCLFKHFQSAIFFLQKNVYRLGESAVLHLKCHFITPIGFLWVKPDLSRLSRRDIPLAVTNCHGRNFWSWKSVHWFVSMWNVKFWYNSSQLTRQTTSSYPQRTSIYCICKLLAQNK